MRDARVVASVDTKDTDPTSLARLMVGRDVDLAPRHGATGPGRRVLVAEDLCLDGRHERHVEHVDLVVRAGEIVGVAGVAGNGQLQLAEMLAGIRQPSAGRILVNGVDITGAGPRAARAAGLGYVPEDRLGTGLAPGLSIADNLQLTAERPLVAGGRRAESEATAMIARFGVKARGPREIVRRLSGGNVQRVLLARELSAGAQVLVVASPTRGLDVGAIVERAIDADVEVAPMRRATSVPMRGQLDEIDSPTASWSCTRGGSLETSVASCDVTELGLAMAGAVDAGP
jgi:simple sugar transport system ATP-binding protein